MVRMPHRADFIEKIVTHDLCTGCGACAALAPDLISLSLDGEGFLRPDTTRNLPRRVAKQVMAVCPGSGQTAPALSKQHSTLWGSYHSVFQGWAQDHALRHAGASGGALSGLCVSLLESGQIDGVVQVTADPENPIGNRTMISRNRADILAAAASRYAPSAPLLDVPSLLESSGRYAFVGKPCDVAALRNWAKSDTRIDRTFPVMISFFCAGVPSLNGAARIAEVLGVAASDVSEFRYRGNGWPGRTVVTDHEGQTQSMTYHESWGGILSKHVQPRCRICADGTGLAADIVFADAWETDAAGYPLFEEQQGRSLIVARTVSGEAALQAAVGAGHVTIEGFEVDGIAAMQPGQVRRRRELLGRLAGRVLAGMPLPKYRGLGIWACAQQAPLQQTIRAALSTTRRALMRKRATR